MRSRMRKGTTSLLGDENARLRTQIAEAKVVVTIERQLQDELSKQLTEARAECERLHKLAYSPHMKDGKPRSWFSVVGDYNARASDEEDRADKAEATRDTAIAVHNAMETQMHTAEANLLSMRAERDELAAQLAHILDPIYKIMKDTGEKLMRETIPARARQLMDIVEAAKYGSRTGEWRKTHEAVLAYQQQESKG